MRHLFSMSKKGLYLALAAGLAALILTAVPFKAVLADGEIAIDKTNFPDPVFREDVKKSYDSDQDGKLTPSELDNIKYIYCSDKDVKTIKGVEFFTKLESLWVGENQISKVDLSHNTELNDLSIYSNKLTELDVTNNTKLQILTVYGNEIKELDVSKCKELKDLNICNTKISTINLSNNKKLVNFYCSEAAITSLDLSKNTALEYLTCTNNKIKKLDLSKNTALEFVYAEGNLITDINLKGLDKLKTLGLMGNKIQKVDLSTNKALQDLWLSENQLSSIDVTKNTNLINLVIGSNKLKELDLSKNTKLETLNIATNNFTTIDVSKNKKLDSLYIADNNFKKINIANNTQLRALDCEGNNISSLDLSKNPRLRILVCAYNPISKLDVSKQIGLEVLEVQGTKISKVDVKNCSGIKHVLKEGEISVEKGRIDEDIIKYEYEYETSEDYVYECLKYEASMTVDDGTKGSVKLDKSNAQLVCGKTMTLKATLKDISGKVFWKSSDESIATVSSSGKVTTKMAGTVTVFASAGGKKAACKITVLYKDVTNEKDFWFIPTNELTRMGVVKGYDKQTMFKPANECTRAQMLTFIWRLMGTPEPKSDKCTFSDVKSSDYFYKPVIWAVEKGITTGYSGGLFKPQNVCTRAQTVTFLWRLSGKPTPKSDKCKFSDVKKDAYYYEPVVWASEKGIVAGYSDGTFKPQGKCLRRQMVTFLLKYYRGW